MPIFGVWDTTARNDASCDQAIAPPAMGPSAIVVSEGHHQAPLVPSTPTTYTLVRSGSTTVRTPSSGSGAKGDARIAKREPSGEIIAECMPRGSGRIRAGVAAIVPMGIGTMANCGTLLT